MTRGLRSPRLRTEEPSSVAERLIRHRLAIAIAMGFNPLPLGYRLYAVLRGFGGQSRAEKRFDPLEKEMPG